MSQINLVPEIKIEQKKLNQVNRYVTVSVSFIAIVLGTAISILVSMNIYQHQKIASLDRDTTQILEELKVYNEIEQTVNSLEEGILGIEQVLANDKKWSLLYEELENVLPGDTRFSSLKVASDNTVIAIVEGSDVKSVDRFIKSFEGYKTKDDLKLFENITVSGYTKGDGGKIIFEAHLGLVEGVLW